MKKKGFREPHKTVKLIAKPTRDIFLTDVTKP